MNVLLLYNINKLRDFGLLLRQLASDILMSNACRRDTKILQEFNTNVDTTGTNCFTCSRVFRSNTDFALFCRWISLWKNYLWHSGHLVLFLVFYSNSSIFCKELQACKGMNSDNFPCDNSGLNLFWEIPKRKRKLPCPSFGTYYLTSLVRSLLSHVVPDVLQNGLLHAPRRTPQNRDNVKQEKAWGRKLSKLWGKLFFSRPFSVCSRTSKSNYN